MGMHVQDQLESRDQISNSSSFQKPRNRAFRAKVASLVRQTTALSLAIQALQFVDLPELVDEIDFYEEVKRFEIALIERALWRTSGSQTEAARLLQLNLSTLNSKVKTYDIHVTRLLTSEVIEKQSIPIRNQK
ncbi:MAG TPA: helix-turn-helix domain-containing protein [Pyrinomonadaceae bacterium]|jgi:DNA-binding NtrC family response regulator|nr:helix-turn-helix domain-containing protein [Pyrinomonadaceae bacterium]